MQRSTGYNILPSLEHLAMVRVASRLFNDMEIGNKLEVKMSPPECFNCDLNKTWNVEIDKKVIDSLSSLLPVPLPEKVSKVIRHLHREVFRWKVDHSFLVEHIGKHSSIYDSCLCWRTDGTINRDETAKNLLANEKVDSKIRFITACTYFREAEVSSIWSIFSEVDKDSIITTGTSSAVRFWMQQLAKGDTKHWKEEIDGYFKVPSILPSDVPLRISSFYNFLSLEVKKEYVKLFGQHQVHTDDLRMCVKDKDERERRELFCSSPDDALFTCLRWPFRSNFLKMAAELINYMTAESFTTTLLAMIFSYIHDENEDFQLFEEFWHLSPVAFKDEVLRDIQFVLLTKILLEKESNSQPLQEVVRKCYLNEALHNLGFNAPA